MLGFDDRWEFDVVAGVGLLILIGGVVWGVILLVGGVDGACVRLWVSWLLEMVFWSVKSRGWMVVRVMSVFGIF